MYIVYFCLLFHFLKKKSSYCFHKPFSRKIWVAEKLFKISALYVWHIFSLFQDDKWFGAILRILLVTLTGIVVILVPGFADIMSLIGATCCTLLAFIMPALCHLTLFRPDLSKKQQLFDMCLLFVGCLGMALGTNDAIRTILRNRSMKPVKSI